MASTMMRVLGLLSGLVLSSSSLKLGWASRVGGVVKAYREREMG